MAIGQYSEVVTAVENWLATTAYSGRSAEFIAMAEDRIADDVRCRAMEAHIDLPIRAAISGGTSTGGANTLTLSTGTGLTALLLGHRFTFTANATNTAATTATIDSAAAADVKKYIGGIVSALEASDIVSGMAYELVHDGTQLLLCPRGGCPLPSRFLEHRRLFLSGQEKPLDFYSSDAFWDLFRDDAAGRPFGYTIEGDYLIIGPTPDGTYAGKLLYYRRFATFTANGDTNWLLQNRRAIYVYGPLIEAAPFLGNDPRIALWTALYDDAVEKVNLTAERSKYGGGPLVIRHGIDED